MSNKPIYTEQAMQNTAKMYFVGMFLTCLMGFGIGSCQNRVEIVTTNHPFSAQTPVTVTTVDR